MVEINSAVTPGFCVAAKSKLDIKKKHVCLKISNGELTYNRDEIKS